MRKCSKTLKITLLLAGVYTAFMAVLLTGISSAKYQETRMAYTNFGAASFNAVILNEPQSGVYTAFDVFEAPVELSQVSGYRPGMTYQENSAQSTAQQIPFTVANGVDATNASEASVQYEIRLRTTNHLPLKYTLRHGETNYVAGAKTQITESGTIWYEQCFYPAGEGTSEEVTFELAGGTTSNGQPTANDYTLIVEWPVVQESGDKWTNDVKYMKEVELLELFVIVSSKNMLEGNTSVSGPEIQAQPGTGIVILDPDEGNTFIHTLDYRAFIDAQSGSLDYTFCVENGVGKHVTHTGNPSYTMEIEVPYTPKTSSFGYALKDEEGQTVSLTSAGYRLYDVLYGKGVGMSLEEPAQAEIQAWEASDSPYKLYKVYQVSAGQPVGLSGSEHDKREYTLLIDGTNAATLESIAFDHKIDIIVTTGGSQSARIAEGGGAGG